MPELGSIPEDLLPLPRRVEALDRDVVFGDPLGLALPCDRVPDAPVVRALENALERHGARLALEPEEGSTRLRCSLDAELGPQGYRLLIEPVGPCLVAADTDGLHHGLWTLVQLLERCERRRLPGLRIDDAPAILERGVMLDVSRNRVPTMETLFSLVETLARWRFNRLQLYTEHTFAYTGHGEVWRGASPITAAEVRALDTCCRAHRIELVPNQQSFGHMHHWLVHERLRPLAECPDGVEHPFSREREPFSLCPTDPRALEFVAGLQDELLACHSSRTLNVGCDETFDLGLGRSKAACAERGTGVVYLEYLRALADRLAGDGVTMQFWADILLEHPELARSLPANVVPMLWGYERDHPFDGQARVLEESGRPFHVCPGTSTWQSFGGRLENMVGNVEAAVGAAVDHGARGLLITDWGDRGHLQPWVTSYPGWVTAADLAWNPDAPASRRSPEGVAALLGTHLWSEPDTDPAVKRSLADACVSLARIADATGARIPNASPLSVVLTRFEEALPPPALEGLTVDGLRHALELVTRTGDRLEGLGGGPDALRARDELRLAAGLTAFAARLGIGRLEAGGDRPVGELPPELRRLLAGELDRLAQEHRRLWPGRSRPGGLADSLRWLERPGRALCGG